MDTQKKRSVAVDDILDELKAGKERPLKRDAAAVEDILAELSGSAVPRRPAGTSQPRQAGAVRPAQAVQQVNAAAKAAPQAPAATQQAAPTQNAPRQAQAAQSAPQKAPQGGKAGEPDTADEPPARAARPAQPELFDGIQPPREPSPADSTLVMERPSQRMNRINRGKLEKGHTGTILDIAPEHTLSIPRVGKAAALDKVDGDKFSQDEELLSWFQPEQELTGREKRRMEKERRKQEAAERKRAKKEKGPAREEEFLDEEDFLPVAQRELEPEPPQKRKPPKPQNDTPLGGSAFDKSQDAEEWPTGGSLFDAKESPRVAPAKKAPRPAEDDWVVVDSSAGLEEPLPESLQPRDTGAVSARPRAQQPVQPRQQAPAKVEASRVLAPKGEQARPAARQPAGVQPAKPEAAPPSREQNMFAGRPAGAGTAAAGVATSAAMAAGTVKAATAAAPKAPAPQAAPRSTAQPQQAVQPKTSAQSEPTRAFDPPPAQPVPPREAATRAAAVSASGTAVFTAVKPGADGRGTGTAPRPAAPVQQGAPVQQPPAPQASPVAQAGAAAPAATTPAASGSAGKPTGKTQTYELPEEEKEEKIPTASYTQEFDPADAPDAPEKQKSATQELQEKEGRSLFLDDMVDDSFRAFFGETIIVDKQELEETGGTGKTRRRNRKAAHTSLFTGEFAQLALDAEAQEAIAAELGEETEDDYSRPQDADKVQANLEKLKKALTARTVSTTVIGALLFLLGIGYGGILPLPGFMQPAASPVGFSLVYLVLVVAALAINYSTVLSGLAGIVSAPTVDTAPALAGSFALVQGVVLFSRLLGETQPEVTLFGGLAALVLAANALGKLIRARVILDNFHLTSGGFDHSAAYVVDGAQHQIAASITDGLEEKDPVLLVSRPTAFVKGFMKQSFSLRQSDYIGRILGWALGGVAIVIGIVSYVVSGDFITAITSATALLCIGAPFSSTLVSAIPSAVMQQNNAKVGAVVAGWSAIEDLGDVNVVMAGGRDLFPPTSVQLKGIKTYEKERIDLAILYAASVLIEGCDTLKDIFAGVIQGKSDMLYKVESLTNEPGRGFTAWVENHRIVIGTREMLQRHDITPPSMEAEVKYTSKGYVPVYLAVSGKLCAMFVMRYSPDPEVAGTLESLVRSGLSLLVTSDDMNITAELIERVYDLPAGVIKVLGKKELDLLEPMTAYAAESEGVMSHIGTFTSFIGGMRAAASCAISEKWSSFVQIAAVVLAAVICFMMVVSGGLAGLSMTIALLYQLAWTLAVSATPFLHRF